MSPDVPVLTVCTFCQCRPASERPWHGCIVRVSPGLPQSPAQSPALQRRCFHNPRSLNSTRRYVLTVAGDYVDSVTMANSLNTEHVSPLFRSETKCPSYYISGGVWDSKCVDNQDRQPSNSERKSNIDNILSQSGQCGLFSSRLSVQLMNLFSRLLTDTFPSLSTTGCNPEKFYHGN